MPRETGWRCPQCGRRFRQRTREHSCDVRPLAVHLDRGSPAVQKAATAVLDILAKLGPHAVVPVKTMILVRAGSNFASLVVRQQTVDLGFLVPRLLSHPRIHKTEKVGPSRYAYYVRLTTTADVDAQVGKWLREAYEAVTRKGHADADEE